jgi:hypothetical protein
MKIILSIFAVIVVLIILFVSLFYFLLKPLQNKDDISPHKKSISIQLVTPENNSVTENEIIKIAGRTQNNALIAAASDKDSQVVKAEPDGNFSFDFKLNPGFNEIELHTVNDQGENYKTAIQTYLQK